MTKEAAKPERKHAGFYAKVEAKWLTVLRPFLNQHDNLFEWNPRLDGFHIRPHPDGGVSVMATNGRVMVVVHDKEGKTSKPVRLTVSNDLLDACEPPKLPSLWAEGCDVTPNYPTWMLPKWVDFWGISAWVRPDESKAAFGLLYNEMLEDGNLHRTGEEYRILGDDPLDWSRMWPSEQSALSEGLTLSPDFLGDLCQAATKAGAKGLAFKGSGGDTKPVIVEFEGAAEVSALLMPIYNKTMTADQLRFHCDNFGHGGQTKLAEAVGWSDRTMRNKLAGKSPITKVDALAVTKAVEAERVKADAAKAIQAMGDVLAKAKKPSRNKPAA